MLKKKILSVLLACTTLLSSGIITSCDSMDNNTGNSADANGKTTITYWHIFPEGDVFKPVHDELIKRFNESQNDIYVEDLGISFFDFLSKMDTAIPAGTGPDVAFYDLVESQRRAEAGVLVDLTPYIERDNFDMSQFTNGRKK